MGTFPASYRNSEWSVSSTSHDSDVAHSRAFVPFPGAATQYSFNKTVKKIRPRECGIGSENR